MANDFTLNIAENFNLERFTEEVMQLYQGQGFQVRSLQMKNSIKLVFDKKCGGINYLLGLGQGITANCSIQGKNNDILSVRFTDGDWIGKIVGCAVGWCFCLIPFITAIIGIFRQLSLPKNISNDMQMIISNMD